MVYSVQAKMGVCKPFLWVLVTWAMHISGRDVRKLEVLSYLSFHLKTKGRSTLCETEEGGKERVCCVCRNTVIKENRNEFPPDIDTVSRAKTTLLSPE